jgi:electron transfer flavoprotein beta subunit
MKKVVVCYKWVLDDADIRVDDKTRQLVFDKAKGKINEYDRNGLEAGVQIKNATGCELIGITCGEKTADSTKDALSRGPDSVSCLNDAVMGKADSRTTARILAAMITKIGDVDAVICSEGSSDEYAQQNGARLAALLGWPSVTNVNGIELAGDTFKLSRKMDDGAENVEVAAPVVITVIPEVNDPPIPSVKQILGAKKKPATDVSLADIGLSADACAPQLNTASVLAPVVERKRIRINTGDVSIADAAAKLVKQLQADGVV